MPSRSTQPHRRCLAGILVATVLALLFPPAAAAHSDLKSSEPVEGAMVPSPFSGPVVLTFSEHLAAGSKAEIYGAGRELVASATVHAATMTLSLISPLAPGSFTVEWVSIADDGDLLRGTLTFSVAPPAASPTPAASPSIPAESSAPATSPPSAAPTADAATPGASTASLGTTDTGSTGGDVVLPIAIALIVAAAGAFYLVRRNRPA